MTSTKDLSKYIHEVGEKTSKIATARLRVHAYDSGWPSELTRNLTVQHFGNGQFGITYPEDLESAILDQELGTQDSSPNPVMRTFMNRFESKSVEHDSLLASLINDWKVF
jgi:hypothetical protein